MLGRDAWVRRSRLGRIPLPLAARPVSERALRVSDVRYHPKEGRETMSASALAVIVALVAAFAVALAAFQHAVLHGATLLP